MSDVPFSRACLQLALDHCEMSDDARSLVALALSHLTREPAIRRAPGKRVKLTPEVKEQIRDLAGDLNNTMHQISEETGVHNIGRVSEVLTGKR